jgi:hypothetical protein
MELSNTILSLCINNNFMFSMLIFIATISIMVYISSNQ